MTDIVQKKFSKLVYIITSTPTGHALDVVALQRPQSEVAMLKQHQAELIIEIRDDGRTEIVKNRYGQTGQVTADAPVHDIKALEDDLKKFLGLAPYNTQSNHCWGDTYFGHSLERRYGKNITTLRGLAGL